MRASHRWFFPLGDIWKVVRVLTLAEMAGSLGNSRVLPEECGLARGKTHSTLGKDKIESSTVESAESGRGVAAHGDAPASGDFADIGNAGDVHGAIGEDFQGIGRVARGCAFADNKMGRGCGKGVIFPNHEGSIVVDLQIGADSGTVAAGIAEKVVPSHGEIRPARPGVIAAPDRTVVFDLEIIIRQGVEGRGKGQKGGGEIEAF